MPDSTPLRTTYRNRDGEEKTVVYDIPLGLTAVDAVFSSEHLWVKCRGPDGGEKWLTLPLPKDYPAKKYGTFTKDSQQYKFLIPDDLDTAVKLTYWPSDKIIEMRYKSIPGPERIWKAHAEEINTEP
jgi:hypothetical protein